MLREFTLNEVWYLLFAARWTLALTAIAFTGGGLLGLLVMLLRVVPLRPAQWLAIGYIQTTLILDLHFAVTQPRR
jgi:polar amino acid transport system permease protein